MEVTVKNRDLINEFKDRFEGDVEVIDEVLNSQMLNVFDCKKLIVEKLKSLINDEIYFTIEELKAIEKIVQQGMKDRKEYDKGD